MAIRPWHGAHKRLTHGAIVLSPARTRRGWAGSVTLAVLALLAGAAANQLFWLDHIGAARQHVVSTATLQALQQDVERVTLEHRVSVAHSQELERQVDALTQQLRQQEDELTFFRKARGGPTPPR
jgi:uncharacterized membrane protein (Fun14 family)